MGHVICSVKTGPIQSIVKLNVFNYFEEKSKVALHKYEKAVEHNNEIILQNPESESSTKLTIFVDMSWMLKFLISLVLVLHLKFYTYFWD
jgi:hypothetical protein